MRRPWKFVLAAVFFLVLLEATLRVAGFVYLRINSRGAADGAPHAVLCLGDSHTFGIWLHSSDAYPARLQSLIKTKDTKNGGAFAVVNRGVPGMASGDVLARLRESLRERAWDAVVITVGANDRWKGLETPSDRAWYDSIQIVKLIKLFAQPSRNAKRPARDTSGVVFPDEVAGTPTPGRNDSATVAIVDRSGQPVQFEQPTSMEMESDASLQQKIIDNLQKMAATAREAGTRIFFVSYASRESDLGLASDAMERGAKAAGLPFVNLAQPAREAGSKYQKDGLYFKDFHPRGAMCELVARAVFNQLVDAGVVNGEKITDLTGGLPVVQEAHDAPFELSGSLAGGDLSILIKTDPKRLVHVFLSFTEGPPADVLGSHIPIGRDALFEKTIDPANPTATRVVAGEDGIAKVNITKLLAGATVGERLYVAAALLGVDGGAGLHKVTDAASFLLKSR